MDVLPTMERRKRGSSAMMSGSGYWSGSSFDQSRGVGTGETCGCGLGACAATAGARVMPPSVAARNERRSQDPCEVSGRFNRAMEGMYTAERVQAVDLRGRGP